MNFLLKKYKRVIVFYHENDIFNNYEIIEFIDKQKQNRNKSNAIFDEYSLNFRNEFLSKTMKKVYNYRKIQFNYIKRFEIYFKKIMNDYYFIILNFVVFCNIYANETQKMCE